MKRQRGFTLIEILIVVIILAVLAAMVLPRFMGQTENAYIAEAQQTLGILRRAYTTALDLGLTPGAVATSTDMPTLGLKAIGQTNFTYACDTAGKCTATSTRTTTNKIDLALDGTYTCTGYTAVSSTDSSKGCRSAS